MKPTGAPSLNEALETVFQAVVSGQHGPIPGEVQNYDSAKQEADVKPLVKFWVDGVLSDPPILRSVRVLWPGGGDGSLTFPLAQGDVVDLVPQGVDISAWAASGSKFEAAPTQRRFSLSDVVAYPKLTSRASPLPSSCVHATCPVLSGNPVLLGDSTAEEFVALALKVLTELQAIQTWASAHTHTGCQGGTPVTPMPDPDSVAATKVKAK